MCDKRTAVITLDGPAAVGKGTVAQLLASQLRFYYLDSGKLYRAVAWQALKSSVPVSDAPPNPNSVSESAAWESAIGECAKAWAAAWQNNSGLGNGGLDDGGLSDSGGHAGRGNPEVWAAAMQADENLSRPEVGDMASLVAKVAAVRQALLPVQRAFRQPPGLVADGRDMGTVVFADADMKVYLDAPVQIRAERRTAQLQEKGFCAKISQVLAGLKERDERDSNRKDGALKVPPDSFVIDSSSDSALCIANKLALEFARRQQNQ